MTHTMELRSSPCSPDGTRPIKSKAIDALLPTNIPIKRVTGPSNILYNKYHSIFQVDVYKNQANRHSGVGLGNVAVDESHV